MRDYNCVDAGELNDEELNKVFGGDTKPPVPPSPLPVPYPTVAMRGAGHA
jgi:hypothetical protein